MSILEGIKAQYRDYRLGKIDRMARTLNAHEGRVQAAQTSPGVTLPNKLKIELKTLPKQLSIAKDAERAMSSIDRNPAQPKGSVDESFLKSFEAYARTLGIAKIGDRERRAWLIPLGQHHGPELQGGAQHLPHKDPG
jgi:hypothetical protein